VVAVAESRTEKELQTTRFELKNFVCEGEYQKGFVRILESYLRGLEATEQPAAWVSGFFGSGKSHLLKMFRYLWVDTIFDGGARAQGLVELPTDVKDLLRELGTMGRRFGGLHAAAGTLTSGEGEDVRLTILSIVLRSKDLPERLPQANFCLSLQRNGTYDRVRAAVEKAGRDFMKELDDLYVSPVIANAILEVDPTFAGSEKEARAALREQYPSVKTISTAEFIKKMREVLSVDGKLPCTMIALDEVQQYIGDNAARSLQVQEAAEAICKQMDSRVLLIGAGQSALRDTPSLQKLMHRFTASVELKDEDADTVTRRVVLAKKADKKKAVEDCLELHSGEISRQLAQTAISEKTKDREIRVDDYPLLPVRRRFWEVALRAVDVPGTTAQLRTQLKIVHEAVRETADEPLGTVVSADFIFGQVQADCSAPANCCARWTRPSV